MTDRRQLIRDCWVLALSVGLALSPMESEAQPRRGGPPRDRDRRRRRRGPRWGFNVGFGPKSLLVEPKRPQALRLVVTGPDEPVPARPVW